MLEVAAPEDQNPVEAVGADGADPALGEGVRVGVWGAKTLFTPPDQRDLQAKPSGYASHG
jgi:hypothetical protein